MNKKFMRIKRMVIPVITLTIVASQLMGCAAVSQSELLSMINRGESIEIEVAVPAFAEQELGEEQELVWTELASLDSQKDIRRGWDNELLTSTTATGKNGMLYVNGLGENENNNTLRQALHNREFIRKLDDKAAMAKLAEAVRKQYADMDETDSDKKAVYMGLNGYFNLIPDNKENYCNADSTISRAEFMAMAARAEMPVNGELAESGDFTNAVGASKFNRYAQELAGNSYLDLASKSLNSQTYNGSITRAEAIYMLMSRYFGTEMLSVDTKGVTFSDCKDGGNIAEKEKFIESGEKKEYWRSYELTYALQNPDKGIPGELYKGLVIAKNKGIIGNETRWAEAVTKVEAVEFIVETLKQEKGIEQFSYAMGVYENEKSEEFIAQQEAVKEGNADKEETKETDETDESNGVNSVGEDTVLGEGDYKETDIEADMILSEDLQKIYDSFSEEDKALYRELMKDVDTSDTTPPSTGTTPPSTGTVPSTGTGGYGQLMPEEDLDPDYVHGQGDYSELSTTAVGY